MADFKIIPVLDIMNSEAVHAVRGERAKYLPLQSELVKTSNPVEVIKILKQKFNFSEFYIADLDAIIKKRPNFEILSKILKNLDVKINIDPGIVNKEDILKYSELNINKLILGLESIKNYDVIDNCINTFGQERVIVSIDMFDGKIISNIKELSDQNPIVAINKIKRYNINELILLDLKRVGRKMGGIPRQYLEIRQKFKGNLLVGGGIKDIKDVVMYKNKGFSGVLIATALHDGTIDLEELKSLNEV